MTEGLRKAGVGHRNTLDFDPKKASDSNLSLEQLHDMMQDGDHRCRHHLTQKCWNILFAAPDCSTYSIAQSTKIYRTESEICILGFVYMYTIDAYLVDLTRFFVCCMSFTIPRVHLRNTRICDRERSTRSRRQHRSPCRDIVGISIDEPTTSPCTASYLR